MVEKDFGSEASYEKGFQINDLFLINGVGLTTAHDDFVIKESKTELLDFYKKFQSSSRDTEFLHKEFNVRKKTGWDILQGYDNIKNESDLSKYIKPISYRPFDNRFIFYEDKLVWRTVRKVMQHFTLGENIGLTLCKQFKTGDNYVHAFIANKIIESSYVSNRTSEITSTFPLYIYPETNGQQKIQQSTERTPNLNAKIVKQIAENLGLTFTNEPFDSAQDSPKTTFAHIDLLDYIYAVLHSPTYREKYKEFLKIDFPRVPYPKDQATFWPLVKLGGELRHIHLLESPKAEQYLTQYPIDGDNVISRKISKSSPGYVSYSNTHGKVYINDTQYFANVPQVAWEFYIGGYQPAQKWLKDRKERKLEFDDILHYQKIIVALTETDRLMKEIDNIEIE